MGLKIKRQDVPVENASPLHFDPSALLSPEMSGKLEQYNAHDHYLYNRIHSGWPGAHNPGA